jgi:hypothetical protein
LFPSKTNGKTLALSRFIRGSKLPGFQLLSNKAMWLRSLHSLVVIGFQPLWQGVARKQQILDLHNQRSTTDQIYQQAKYLAC